MKIYYGIRDNIIDVTQICYNKLLVNNTITIPKEKTYVKRYLTIIYQELLNKYM